MNKDKIIKETVNTLQQLPAEKIGEVNDFAAFLLSKIDDAMLTKGIAHAADYSKSFSFLSDEKETYTLNDVKEVYHAKK
jgi:hypothetical protein